MQFKAQFTRLKEVEMIDRERMIDPNSTMGEHVFTASFKNSKVSDALRASTVTLRVSAAQALAYQNQLQQPSEQIEVFTERRGGICYNIKELFNYRPAT